MADINRIYAEFELHLLGDERPSVYLNSLGDEVYGLFPYNMLAKLRNTPQSPIYHPEGSAWNHTMLVVDEAAKRRGQSSDSRVFMWAALLHDIGKPDTTRERKGKITSYDHDRVGAKLAVEFLTALGQEEKFIHQVTAPVRWHMQLLHVVQSNRFADIPAMRREVPIEDVALLGMCDRMGRLGADQKKELENVRIFLKKCGL